MDRAAGRWAGRLGGHLALWIGAVAGVPEARAAEARGAWSTGISVQPGGALLPEVPARRPDQSLPPGTDPVDLAAVRAQAGDIHGAVLLLEDWLAGRHPELRARGGSARATAARFQIGMLYLRQERYNLASAQFTRVRAADGPLAAEAAWYEALCDEERDRHAVAARECAAYRERWPEGSHARDCLSLMGEAYAAAGTWGAAQETFKLILEEDPEGPDAEAARLGQALALTQRAPAQAVPALQALALDYAFATTPVRARAALAELTGRGLDTAVPDDTPARQRRLLSALRAREYTLARDLWTQLASDPDPAVRAWTEEKTETMGWRGRDFSALVEFFGRRWEAAPSPEGAWMAHRAAARGALWKEAAAWGERGLAEHRGSWRWSQAEGDVARAWMLAGDQDKARSLWDKAAARGGSRGAEARWYGALSAWLAQDLPDARARLERVRASDAARATRALYYLGKVARAEGREEEARRLFEAVIAEDDEGWYALLARSRIDPPPPGQSAVLRRGTWPYPVPQALPAPGPLPVVAPPALAARPAPTDPVPPPPRAIAWAKLGWSPQPIPAIPAALPASTVAAGTRGGEIPPDAVADSGLYDAGAARLSFARFVEANTVLWPELPAIQILADVGATDLSGELMARLFDEIERARKGSTARDETLRAVQLPIPEWRTLFLHARSWHLVARFSAGLEKSTSTPTQRRALLALAYPPAFPEHVWPWSRAHGVDPLLVLGVMRQESAYKSWAVSPADAVGLLQVLPVTGALVARDLGEERFSPRDLLDPATSVRFGTWYLGRLIARFQGSMPLAVAAYNAGPQAVGGWLAAQPDDQEVDDFVELIPVDETRNYVRRVIGFYALNVAIHGPTGARVALDVGPAHDDPAVIDY